MVHYQNECRHKYDQDYITQDVSLHDCKASQCNTDSRFYQFHNRQFLAEGPIGDWKAATAARVS